MDGKTLLIVANDITQQDQLLNDILTNHEISQFDKFILQSEKSIGIADIKIFHKQTTLKPLHGNIKACIILGAHTLTLEAQNALLKLLEEPPQNTLLILVANDIQVFLPTVLSRCTIIKIEEKISLQKKDTRDFYTQTKGQRLQHGQELTKNKDEALRWLEDMIFSTREELITHSSLSEKRNLISYLRSLQKTHTLLKTTNANTRLVLENLFLSM